MHDSFKIAGGVALAIIAVGLLASCNGCRQDFKRIKSTSVGIERTITLFDATGKVIKVWNIDSTYQSSGTGINFIDKNEKFVAINGTFIVEEK
jgi:hypothetical protein